LPVAAPSPPKRRGHRPATMPVASRSPWLYHHLTISGPADVVTAFAEAARGAGIVPWRVDGARLEEAIFNLAASQPKPMRSLTIEGCRILARHFRERVEARAAQAAARVGRSSTFPGRDCPFDLHTCRCRPVSWSLARAIPRPRLGCRSTGASPTVRGRWPSAARRDSRAAAAARLWRHRLQLLYGAGDAACGGGAARRAMARAALRAPAAPVGLTGRGWMD
jgi:hypothetical protein